MGWFLFSIQNASSKEMSSSDLSFAQEEFHSSRANCHHFATVQKLVLLATKGV